MTIDTSSLDITDTKFCVPFLHFNHQTYFNGKKRMYKKKKNMINNIETLAGGKINNEQGLLAMDPFRISGFLRSTSHDSGERKLQQIHTEKW